MHCGVSLAIGKHNFAAGNTMPQAWILWIATGMFGNLVI
jgi:hypothetical protein